MGYSKHEIESAIDQLKRLIQHRRIQTLVDPRNETNKKFLLQDENQLEKLKSMIDPEIERD